MPKSVPPPQFVENSRVEHVFQINEAAGDAVIVNDLDVDFALLRNRPEREVRERRNRVMLSFSGPNNSLSRSPWRWPHSLT